MYERNAIVIDRYFAEMFGYDEKNNLKNNYKNYSNLVSKVEEYQNISKKEDEIMVEFEKVASEIKETQKSQESLYKRCLKLQETRNNLFDSLDESMEVLQRRFVKIEEEINKNNEEIKQNSSRFVERIGEFNEESESRVKCGRERRIAEDEYHSALNDTNGTFEGINQVKVAKARQFLKQEDVEEIKDEIKNRISKNGAKEKVPFNSDVITKAINIATTLEGRKLELLVSVYEKTARILSEIKNDSVKIERHKKYLKDTESKLQFLNVISEYIILFLDNERMSVAGGEKEHKKIMDEACKNVEKDIEQIENLYDLLAKEITGKTTKKLYKDKYNPEYLQGLLEEEKEFEKSVSRLKVMGTIIYPSYWRVEGMQKVYDVFKNIITDVYDKDLSEFEPLEFSDEKEEIFNDSDDEEFDWGEDDEESNIYNKNKEDDDIWNEDEDDSEDDSEDIEDDEEDEKDNEEKDEDENNEEDDDEWKEDENEEDDEDEDIEDEESNEDEEDDEDEEDKVIDEILGFYSDNGKEDDDEIDLFEDDEENENSEEDEDDDDLIDLDDLENLDLNWDDEEKEDKEEKEEKKNKKKSKKRR